MNVRDGFVDSVGDTPLIRLRKASEETGCTILGDYGTRYQSKLFNPAFLREKGLPCPEWLEA